MIDVDGNSVPKSRIGILSVIYSRKKCGDSCFVTEEGPIFGWISFTVHHCSDSVFNKLSETFICKFDSSFIPKQPFIKIGSSIAICKVEILRI